MKKLKGPGENMPLLLEAIAELNGKLGPLLFQLPPHWHVNRERLRIFLHALPKGIKAAFELRDPSWHTKEILDLLAGFDAAFCVYDIGGVTSPRVW